MDYFLSDNSRPLVRRIVKGYILGSNIKWFENGLKQVANWSVVAITALLVLDQLFRTLHVPFVGTYEVVSLWFGVTSVLCVAFTQHRRRHITVTVLYERYPSGVKEKLHFVTALCSLIIGTVIVWRVLVETQKALLTGDRTLTLRLPVWPFYSAMVLGFVFFVLASITSLTKDS